ncbi:DUF1491 family protein [Pyruvatibacter mobilis]|uniref:DUF1491 family protein n=1 Tax=Pyruvatibacter mobilis TaxID=1712261 RepID=UPI003BAB9722
MMQPRLKSEIRVHAMLRGAAAAGIFGAVLRRGDDTAGAIIVRLAPDAQTAMLYCAAPGPGTDDDGRPRWICATGPDPVPNDEADAWLTRRVSTDPDLWVVEFETAKSGPCLDGTVVDTAPPQEDPLIAQIFRK